MIKLFTDNPGREMTAQNVSPEEALRASIIRTYAEVIWEVTGIEPEEIEEQQNHVNDLGLDSLSMVEIAVQFEDAYGVKTPDEDLAGLVTVKDVIDYACTIVRNNPQAVLEIVRLRRPAEIDVFDAYITTLQ